MGFQVHPCEICGAVTDLSPPEGDAAGEGAKMHSAWHKRLRQAILDARLQLPLSVELAEL